MPNALGVPSLGAFYLGDLAMVTVPPSWLQRPHCTVTIHGVVQDAITEWHTDAGLDRISTADLTMPFPMGAEAIEGAAVTITAAAGEDDPERLVFSGRINVIETSLGEDGRTAHVRCAGSAWALTLPLEADLVFGGGAAIDAQLLTASTYHLGDDTISWYADTTPDGLSVDLLFAPRVDARFVRVTGRQHGANSYQEDPDRDLKDFSRVEIWQSGRMLGYANMPRDGERYRDQIAYTADAEWSDFAMTIGARIDGDGGDVTVRFVSGRKPGSKERDEYEIKGVSYQTAGRQTARDLARSLLRDRGYGASLNGVTYRVTPVTDLYGAVISLGGNGLINNGQIRLTEKTQPWSWLTQMVNLWGFRVVDGPDALEIVPVRGDPGNLTPVAVYTDGVNLFRLTRVRDVGEVVTGWNVYGASGSDENGEPFQYESFSAIDRIATPAYLPNPPGIVAGELRSDLLVSDYLARTVRHIKEVEHESLPVQCTLDTVPSPTVKPGSVVRIVSAAEGIDRAMWVMGVRHDFDDGGFWSSLTVRVGTGTRNAEADPASQPRDQTVPDTRHIGQADIAWYARSGADGLSVSYGWHPGGAYRGVRVTGGYHGANSWATGSKAGTNTSSTVEIWQSGVKLGSASLPHHPERYDRQQAYSSDAFWADFDVMIAADVVDASAEVRFVSGTARDASRDEYEVKAVMVTLYAEATEQGAVATSGADWHAYQSRRVWRWSA